MTRDQPPGPSSEGPSGRLPHAWGAYIRQFAWDHVATLTFRFGRPGGAIRELHDRWLRRLARNAQHSIPAFYGLERGTGGRLHLHVLTAGTAALTLAELRQAWKAGVSEVKRYDPARGAAWYVTKGVLARCEWFDVTRRMPRRLPGNS